jgi:superfamily II DNA helicase RecQ
MSEALQILQKNTETRLFSIAANEIIDSVCGQDNLMPTGGGKSVCFQMMNEGICLVISSPLVASNERPKLQIAIALTGGIRSEMIDLLDNCQFGL